MNCNDGLGIFQFEINSKSAHLEIKAERKISALRNVNDIPSVFETICIKSSKLFGHVKRPNIGPPKSCLDGSLPGKGRRAMRKTKIVR